MTTTYWIAAASCIVLTALVETSPRVRLPLGLLLAIVLLASGLELLPVVVLGALGATIGRALIALEARRDRDRTAPSAAAQARQDALRTRLAGSSAYGRLAFTTAALPFVPSSFLFSLLGAMRAPLLPALTGSFCGLVPILAITTSIFRWLGELLAGDTADPAMPLGIFALVLLLIRSLNLVDWEHRRETGSWRMREPETMFTRFSSSFTVVQGQADRLDEPFDELAGEVLEGEVLGEEHDDDGGEQDSADPSPGGGDPSTPR